MAAVVQLVPLREATPEARADVAQVMLECADYYQLIQGHPADPKEVDDFFTATVPGIPPEDVRGYGLYAQESIVGLASIVLGWKRPGQSMIGFLAVSGTHRGKGYARAGYDALEAVARASPHGQSLRIGIVATNAGAFGFWHRLGFRETGERRRLDEFIAEVVILEKELGG